MADKRRLVTQLPVVHQTETLQKFFGATVDKLFQPGDAEQLSGYIGQKPAYYNPAKDFYISEPSAARTKYQLEPAMVSIDASTDAITNVLFYDDLINQLRFQGGLTANQQRLFETDYYCWAPAVDIDKLINFKRYFWLANGPPALIVTVPKTTVLVGDYALPAATSATDAISVTVNGTPTSFVLYPDSEHVLLTSLPNAPSLGDVVVVTRSVGNAETYNITLARDSFLLPANAGGATQIIAKVDGELAQIASTTSTTVTLVHAPGIGSKVEIWRNSNFSQNIGGVTYTIPAALLTANTPAITSPIALTSNMVIEIDDNNVTTASSWDEFAWDSYGTWDEASKENVFVVEGVGTNIILIPEAIANKGESAQYTVMERGGFDENPWSLVNRWFHEDSFAWSGQTFTSVAQRPIVSFYRNIKLFNYGTTRRPDIEAVFDTAAPHNDFLATFNLQPIGVTLNGRVLQDQDRILTLTANDSLINNRVYRVNSVFDASDQLYHIHLTLEVDDVAVGGAPQTGDILRVATAGLTLTNAGWQVDLGQPAGLAEEVWFDGTKWGLAQHRSTDQQAPLFDLYDNRGVALSDATTYPQSSFAGSQIFGFAIGPVTNNPDTILSIPLKFDQYGQIVMDNHLVTHRYTSSNGDIIGYYYYRIIGNPDSYSNDWHLVNRTSVQSIDANGLYDVPLNLQANPDNEEIDFISQNQYFDHFTGIIASQDNFVPPDAAFARNHWRDSKKNLGLGTKILQHRAPLLKLMLLASNSNIDFMLSVRYVSREYTRFKRKFVQTMNEFLELGTVLENDPTTQWVSLVLNRLKIAKNSQFAFAYSGVAGAQFIPPTPAFLGIMPLWLPEKFNDNTFVPAITVIRGHDGSLITAFGDFRDDVLLELEMQIYNSADAAYRTEARPFFDIANFTSGKFRTGDYTRAEQMQILRPMFDRWVVQNQLKFESNTTFVQDEPLTFNYAQMTDYDGEPVPGHWRAIFRWFYDTVRPHSHPWEMLGFTSKPVYWDSRYGPAPYTSGNTLLWIDLQSGYIAGGARQGIDSHYARPGLLAIIPVDQTGALLDPLSIGLITQPTIQQASMDWAFGDGGPVEDAWLTSETYDFDAAQMSYLMKPARFVEECWNPSIDFLAYPTSAKQWTDGGLGKRPAPSLYTVHGETVSTGVFGGTGIQQWISDYVISNGQSVTTMFGNLLRGLGVRLAHKMAGFTTTDNMQVRADNIAGPLPLENVRVATYKSPSTREEFYSGVIVSFTGTGWRVFGYDVLNPVFSVIPGNVNGPKGRLSIAGINAPPIPNWRPNTYYPTGSMAAYANVVYQAIKGHTSAQIFEPKFWNATTQNVTVTGIDSVVTYLVALDEVDTVPYGTEFGTPQEVADFLLGYQRWLVSRGWIFDQIDSTSLQIRDWSSAVQEYLFWISMNWSPGNFVALSPAAAGVKFFTAQGAVQDIEQLINGVYPLLDQNGRNIDSRTTFVSRLDGEMTVVPRNNNIFATRLCIAEIEHVLVFSNTTIFNDIIYQPLFNLRQPRLRLIGVRSQDWAGRLDAPGYMITSNNIVANFEKSPENIRHMFDIEQSNVYTKYARHDVGYQQRPYLNALMFTDTPQFEFFQGMIQQKGAPGVFQKLLRSDFINPTNDIVFLEEWAVRLGDYGATDVKKTIEFQLQQSDVRRNPQLIQFWTDAEPDAPTSDNPYDDKIELIDKTNPLVPDPRWIVRPETPFFFDARSDYAPADAALPTAGYVRTDEPTYHAKSLADVTTLFTTLSNAGSGFNLADHIWVYATPLNAFDVLRVSVASAAPSSSNTLISTIFTPDGTQFTFTNPHGLRVGDLFVLNAPTRSVNDFEGVQTVAALTADPRQVVIADSTTTVNYDFSSNTDNPNGDVGPQVFALKSVRFANAVTLTPADGWTPDEIVYVDNVGGRWNVLSYDGAQFNVIRAQPHKLDSQKIINGRIYANKTVITSLSLQPQPTMVNRVFCFDPVGGLIPGVAEREMTYIFGFDPAKYNAGVIANDPSEAWGEPQVGQVWWDLSAVKFLETELDDLDDPTISDSRYESEIKYRITNWGKLAPDTSIDVYEWVRSTVAPAQWAAAVASESDSLNIFSGTVFNVAAPSWCEHTEYDPVNAIEMTIYFFWVKNRLTFPANMKSRNLSVANVASILSNPTSANIPWLSPVARNSVIVSGVIEFLDDTSTILQINARKNFYEGVAHRQWQLLRPKDATSQPDNQLWRKMRDSLVGRDQLLQPVPDPLLFPSMRYGNMIRPRQSWFSNILGARNVFINAVNLILSRTSLIDDRPNFINDLTATTPAEQALIWVQPVQTHAIQQLPLGGRGLAIDEWDIMVADFDARNNLTVAVGTRVLVNRIDDTTPQWSVWTYRPSDSAADSNGYVVAKAWDIEVLSLTERDILKASLTVGERVLVNANSDTNNFWTIWRFNGTSFDLVKAQTYNTADVWALSDWYAPGFSASNPPSVAFATVAARNAAQTSSSVTFVMITDDGTGRWLWTNYVNGGWSIVAKQNATLAFTGRFFNPTRVPYGINDFVLSNIPNRDGSTELQIIIDLLRDTGLMTPLELNELFFDMLSYVHSEQDQVDWAFKTSFMVIGNFNSPLDQPAVLPPDENQNLLDFVDEVKPYHVKVRDFRASYAPPIDVASFSVSDFDNPVYLDPTTDTFRPLDPLNLKDALIIQTTLPWSLWFASIQPWTQLTTSDPNNSNMAFVNPVRHSKITLLFDRTSCTPGIAPNAASRVSDFYVPQAGMPEANLPDLIGGCQFPGTVVDGANFGVEGVWDGSAWDNQAWDVIAIPNLLLDSVVDCGRFDIDPTTIEVVFDGGSFSVPRGPEERAPVRAHDPIILSIYDNWSAGHPFVTRALYTGDGATTTFSLVHAPQTNEAVAIFVDGVRLAASTITINSAARTATLGASFAPALNSRVEIVGWGVAGLNRIVEQQVHLGDGVTASYATTTALAGTTVFATVNGQVVVVTTGANAVNFGSPPLSGSLVVITIMLAAPTLVHHQDDTGRLSQTTFTIAHPSTDTTATTLPIDATIVEVNGLRVAPSGWSISGSTLTIPSLGASDSVSITTFENNDLMQITTLQYAGNATGLFEIDHLPHNQDYIWLTLQKAGESGGKRLIFGTDFTIVVPKQEFPGVPWDQTMDWEPAQFQGWDEVPWEDDAPEPLYPTVRVNPSLFSADPTQDIVCWTAMSGNPNHHPIAWRVFTNQIGEVEKIRIADVHKTRTMSMVLPPPLLGEPGYGQQVIDLQVNQHLPASFLPTHILATPDPVNNVPGVVWIGFERIEYFTLTVVSPTHLRIGQLRRGSRGTPLGTYSANTLVIEGSSYQRFGSDVHAIYGLDWDFNQWEDTPWDSYEFAQDHTDATAEFLLERYGTYEK